MKPNEHSSKLLTMASYGINDNQAYFVSDGRTTSRVIQPPGGQCSFSLGTAPPPQAKEGKNEQTNKQTHVVTLWTLLSLSYSTDKIVKGRQDTSTGLSAIHNACIESFSLILLAPSF